MLQKGIHLAIVKAVIFCCQNVSSERKRVWGDYHIYDYETWVEAGRPYPTGTLSASEVPEVHPLAILRCLKEFFENPKIIERLLKSITRRTRENIGMIMGNSWVGRIDSTMEFFNGRRYSGNTLEGGLTIGRDYYSGPASNRYSSPVWPTDITIQNPESPEEIDSYYKRWDCDGDFVHERNIGIGFYGSVEILRQGDGWAETFNTHNFASVYGGIKGDIRGDVHPYLLKGNTIVNLSKQEKLTYINMFLKKLCAEYQGEEENSPVDRATWYEVSEFIIFYHDIWSSFGYTEGDEECWMSEHITSGPMTYNLEERSTMYEIPGVWHPSEGGKWSQNFETIMKLQVEDWRNGIWKKKYDTYLQRIFEEDGKEIYFQIINDVRWNLENEGLLLPDRSYNTGVSSGEESEEEQGEQEEQEEQEEHEEQGEQVMYEILGEQDPNPVKEKIKTIMEILFKNTEKIPEGLYLQLSNEMKELYGMTS